MSTMKAVRIHTYGGLDVLAYEDAPCPMIGNDDVLIRVHAAGVNPIDWKVRLGYLAGWLKHTLPLTLGWDVSGVIEEVGANVQGLAAGDAVYAMADPAHDGAYAEYAAVSASLVAAKPAGLDHVHAAAVPLAGLAAWSALFDAAGLTSGQSVLIHGAAGGVGTFAVQLARWRGAHVLGTASARNLPLLHQLGADEPIDYNATRFEDVAANLDVVFDTVGGETQHRSWAVLKPGGILVSIAEAPSQAEADADGVRGRFVSGAPNLQALREMASLIDAGRLEPVVSAVFPLSEARQAHALSESLHVQGKIVLQVTP